MSTTKSAISKVVSLHQTLNEHLDFAGVSDLRLDHHDGDGAVSYVPAVLLMLTRCSPTSLGMKEMPEEKTTSQVLSKQTPSRQEESEHYSSPTDVIVGLPLEQTGLIAARRGFDARGEQTEIRSR